MKRFPKGEQLDRIVAAGLVVAGELQVWLDSTVPGPRGVAALLMLLMTAPVAVRRRWPLGAGTVVLGSTAVLAVTAGYATAVAQGIAWLCALYAIAVWTDRPRFLAGIAVLVVTNLVGLLGPDAKVNDVASFTWGPILAMVLVRGAVRGRELRADALAARAELLEREHELRAHEAVAEERARIARELHDLVAHNVSVMVVQAGAERHALGPEQASTREALASIEQAGRQALVEARRLLGMLRRKDGGSELEPQPSVDHIDVLVEQIERAGLPVSLAVEGERAPLPAGVDLCAYRIVQEGLTNALKHAGPAHAEVVLRYAPRALDVEVRDDGRGPARANGDGAGHGLIGMRERVALYGGALETGARDGGGFEIHAHLPLA
jgi:signal transduction histidine kinase